MDFSKLRHRIVFLKPSKSVTNELGENVPVWVPFKPCLNNNLEITNDIRIYLTADNNGNAVLRMKDAQPHAHSLVLKDYMVWANVSPTTGREYEEAQKLRAETTYSITTRYFDGIKPDCKILYNNKLFDIVSVLNIGELKSELKIIASEMITNAESY